ncbi:MAG: hypothetical protein AAGC55_17630, partial [Myxococcota bacterium]
DDAYGGYFMDARLGGMVNPRLALSVEYWSDGHNADNDSSFTLNSLAVAATFWPRSRLWLRAGLGTSLLSIYQGRSDDSRRGYTFTGAIGYEIAHRGKWAFDLSATLRSSNFNEEFEDIRRGTISFNLGLTRF